MAISNCLFSPTSQNPRGFSRNETIAKHVVVNLRNEWD